MQDEWIEKDGLQYYTNCLSLPENEALQTEIGQGCHDSLVAGHFGHEKTIEIVTRDFYWKGLADWIRDYVHDPATNINTVNPHGMPSTDYFNP